MLQLANNIVVSHRAESPFPGSGGLRSEVPIELIECWSSRQDTPVIQPPTACGANYISSSTATLMAACLLSTRNNLGIGLQALPMATCTTQQPASSVTSCDVPGLAAT